MNALDEGSSNAAGVPPGRVVTLLFTDLVGSTELLEEVGEPAWEATLRSHLALLAATVAEMGGRVVKSLGDGLMVAFVDPTAAVRCALRMQAATAGQQGTEAIPNLRIGLHAGEALLQGDDLVGAAVVVAKRLCDRASGGQILASDTLARLVGDDTVAAFHQLGRLRLKGLRAPVAVVEVSPAGAAAGRPVPSRRSPARPDAGRATDSPPELVGRDRELAILEAELERSARGECRCVLITGEAGIGKTRLAAELVARHPDDVIALSGRGYSLGVTASFGMWAEALERYLRGQDPAVVAQLCGGFLDDLATLLRSVAAAQGLVPPQEAPRPRLLEGLAVLVGNCAEHQPVVAFLDDVHLAEASSWEALQYLIHNLAGGLLVVATARPDELFDQAVAAQVLFGLEQQGFVRRLDLSALAGSDVGELARAVLDEAPPPVLVDWLTARSRGNPLFALGLLRALVEEGADLSAPTLRRLPEGLAERVTAGLRLLDEPAREVLETLAVLGRQADLASLPALSGQPPETVTDAIERVVNARLVVEEERGHEVSYEIAHPLVGEAIYKVTTRLRRRNLHRRVGRALLAGGRLGEAGQHFARAANVGDSEAIAVLRDAVRDAEQRGTYREAVTILASLAELLPSGDERWLEVANALSHQADWVYRGPSHAAMGVRALREIRSALSRSPDPARRAAATFRLATFLAFGTGELEEAEGACAEAVELFRQAGDRPRMLLAGNELASIRAMRGDIAAWEAGTAEVATAAEAAGERFVMMEALGTFAIAAAHRGRFGAAEPAFRRNVAIAREGGKPHRLTMSLTAWASCLSWEGRVAEALPLLEEARAVNPDWRQSLFLEWGVFTYWMAGDYPAVLANADDVGTIGKRGGHAMHFAALAAGAMGQLTRARRYLARAQTAYGEDDWFIYTDFGLYAGAMVAWQEAQNAESLPAIQRVAEKLLRVGVLPYAAWVLVDLAEVAATAGDGGLAEWAAGHLNAIADEIDRGLYTALADIGGASSALAAGDADQAAKRARQAVALLSESHCRGFLGRALDVWGRSLAGRDPTAAASVLQQAADTFEACGAVWRRDRSLDALRRLAN
jgi:class 3 adenylate cyclase/tetratricopeptide (TPR) repeat protein